MSNLYRVRDHNRDLLGRSMVSHTMAWLVTHPQLLEGLKEESQVEDNGKREGVGPRSLTRSTRGVEGGAGPPRLGLGRVTS
jgi:hypothetical protein